MEVSRSAVPAAANRLSMDDASSAVAVERRAGANGAAAHADSGAPAQAPATAMEQQSAIPLTGSAALLAKMRKNRAASGELAAAKPAMTAAPVDGDSKLHILYGGDASVQVAADVAAEARARGFQVQLLSMEDFRKAELDKCGPLRSTCDAHLHRALLLGAVKNGETVVAACTRSLLCAVGPKLRTPGLTGRRPRPRCSWWRRWKTRSRRKQRGLACATSTASKRRAPCAWPVAL